MKLIFKIIPVLLLLVLFTDLNLYAQDVALNSKERFMQLKKIKLLETLDMNEQTANTFLFKFTKMEKDLAQVRDEIDDLNNNLKKLVQQNADDKTLEEALEKIDSKMKEMFNIRKTFMEDAKKLLNTKQYAKFILFEFSFEKQVHRLLMKKHRGGRRGADDDRPRGWED